MPYSDKSQQVAYQREWLAARRRGFFADKTCVECGSEDRLELDHINPDHKVSHRIWSWSKLKREAELSKCQVLCHTCHLRKTSRDRAPKDHGLSMYNRYRCRCDVCRRAKYESNKRSLERRAALLLP